MNENTLQLLRRCQPVFTALGDDNRLLLIHLLHEHGSLNVNELTERTHLSRPAVSHHLKLLREAGLVQAEQRGKERFYTATLSDAGGLFQDLMQALAADGCLSCREAV
ncbi:MAG: metalloregulator ArsR/SmtB family transcription factor [Neisseria sp.]|nr:metalloregulator ArsR/SmtB family transcription factor [Neisseria sp.]